MMMSIGIELNITTWLIKNSSDESILNFDDDCTRWSLIMLFIILTSRC
jgi:hypothetical protein